MKKTIQIKCQGASTLPIDRILEFQGGLKKLTEKNLEKLKKSILKQGFIAPFFVWDNKGEYQLLDGHQRLAALISLRQEDYDIPLLPVDFIDAENEQQARQMLLSISSQYGEFDNAELLDWITQIDDDLRDTLRLVDEEIQIVNHENFEPTKEEDQGRLDKIEPKIVTCPNCGEEFDTNANKN